MILEKELSYKIWGAALSVHKALGPGLLESTYEACLCYELAERGLAYQQQLALPVVYKGVHLECGYRIDILVENSVVLELKALEQLLPVHEAQLMTYMRLSGKRVGILINFNVELLKTGVRRRVL